MRCVCVLSLCHLLVCLFSLFEGVGMGVGKVRKISNSNNFGYVFSILELIIELRIERPWDKALEDKTSEAFEVLSDLLENEVRFIYTKKDC